MIFLHILYRIDIYVNTCPTYLDKLTKINNKILRILQNKDLTLPSPSQLDSYQVFCLVYKFLYFNDVKWLLAISIVLCLDLALNHRSMSSTVQLWRCITLCRSPLRRWVGALGAGM